MQGSHQSAPKYSIKLLGLQELHDSSVRQVESSTCTSSKTFDSVFSTSSAIPLLGANEIIRSMVTIFVKNFGLINL